MFSFFKYTDSLHSFSSLLSYCNFRTCARTEKYQRDMIQSESDVPLPKPAMRSPNPLPSTKTATALWQETRLSYRLSFRNTVLKKFVSSAVSESLKSCPALCFCFQFAMRCQRLGCSPAAQGAQRALGLMSPAFYLAIFLFSLL